MQRMNKTARLACLLFFLALSAGSYAQVERNVIHPVTVGSFDYTPKEEKTPKVGKVLGHMAKNMIGGKSSQQQPDYANDVQAAIVKGFGNVVRFRTVEDAQLDTDELAPDETAFYVDGNISNISTTLRKGSLKESMKSGTQPEEKYNCLINVTINLKDARTHEVVDSRMFNITESDGGWMSSVENAIASSLTSLASLITDYYNELFPLSASIIESGEAKKKKQKTVYIDLGTTFGAYEDQQFNIYSLKTIAGKEARVEIGRLKIEEVLGEEVSLCKVTRGAEEVKTALDKGETLVVTTR